MKKFEGILLCTDLDGTLLKKDGTISQENRRAIEFFQQNGGFFTFVTGRMPFFARHIYLDIGPNAPIGCINGGGIYDYSTESYVWKQELSRDVQELVEYIDGSMHGMGIQVNTFDKIYFCKENSAMERFRRITNMPNLVLPCRQIEEPIAKIVFGDEDPSQISLLAELLKSHPRAKDFDFVHSEQTLYEILPKGIHKGCVLPRLVKHLSSSPMKTIAVGDFDNDIGMLRVADLGIAVANATLGAKQAADCMTVSNEEHAIAQIIEDLEAGRLPL
ncbi:MAG: HAD family phosphatase [Clostridia bacterium]|nr:HAD family phosphatase [Clostridia bacterium]